MQTTARAPMSLFFSPRAASAAGSHVRQHVAAAASVGSSSTRRLATSSSSSSLSEAAESKPRSRAFPGPPGVHLALDGKTPIPSSEQQQHGQRQSAQAAASASSSSSSDDAEWARNLRRLRRERREQAEARQQQPGSTSGGGSIGGDSDASSPLDSSSTSSLLSSSILSALVASGASLGHSASRLAPAFTPYLYGQRAGLHLIDLERATVPLLRQAAALVRDVVKGDGNVLFVGTRPEHRRAVQKAAERLEGNGYAVAGTKWLAGTLTNSASIFGTQPLRARSHLPDLVVILNPAENGGLVRECTISQVPTIGIVDTDTDPRLVTYAVPANVESLRTAELIVSLLSLAGKQGREARLEADASRASNRRYGGPKRTTNA